MKMPSELVKFLDGSYQSGGYRFRPLPGRGKGGLWVPMTRDEKFRTKECLARKIVEEEN